MKIYVVMSNDFPDSVWKTKKAAEEYVKEKMTHPDNKYMSGYGLRIYYRVYDFEVRK